jgi:hypothetical protein
MDVQNLKITVGQMRNLLLAMLQVDEGVKDQRSFQWDNSMKTENIDWSARSKRNNKAN